MTENDNQDTKITEWVRERFGGNYSENRDLARMIYAEKCVAKYITECIPGGSAELVLFIVKAYQPIPVKICLDCSSKQCREYCGKENYADRKNYFFKAGDKKKGLINLRIPPWYDGDGSQVREEHAYRVRGKIQEYNGQLDLIAREIEEVPLAVA